MPTMKTRCVFLTLCLLCALLLYGCGRGNPAEKPCLMAGGTVYYLSPEGAAEALPAGYAPAGTLEKVSGFPRTDMSGSCPEGSELYTSRASPEAVYVRAPGAEAYSCYTTERLQYAWLRWEGELYLWGDHRDLLHPDAGDSRRKEFRGLLPETAVFLGKVGSAVRNALPMEDLQTNKGVFVGYSVYGDPTAADVLYLTPPGKTEALIFLRESEEG